MVVGDNGVLTQSQQASTKTNKATEFETIQLAVAGSFNDEGYLDLATLVNNLTKEMPSGTQVIATKDSENNDIFPVTVTAKYGMYEIDENGKAENTSGVSLSETDLKIFAGSEVTLTATVSSDLVGKTITWSTDDSNVATVSPTTGENVTVTAGTSGSTTITAQVEGGEKVGTCKITIVQAVSSITLDNTTLEIEQGGTGTLTATVLPATDVEDIEFVIDANANEAGAYFGTVGTLTKTVSVREDGKAIVEVNVPEESSYIDKTTTIRAQGENTGNVSGKVGTRTIKVKKAMPIIGQYVEYDVSYADMYADDVDLTLDGNQNFTSTNGWRILNPGTKNSDGSYSGTEIISTGIPMIIYPHRSLNIGNSNNGWWGTDEQVADLFDTDEIKYSQLGYDFSNGGNPNVYVVAGLLKNFELIPLVENGSETNSCANKGWIKMVSNTSPGSGYNTNTASIFITNKTQKIRTLSLEELNDTLNKINNSSRDLNSTSIYTDSMGLIHLRSLGIYENYPNSSEPRYLLSNPDMNSSDSGIFHTFSRAFYGNNTKSFGIGNTIGRTGYSGCDDGIRPVIKLNSPIYKDGDIWKIK